MLNVGNQLTQKSTRPAVSRTTCGTFMVDFSESRAGAGGAWVRAMQVGAVLIAFAWFMRRMQSSSLLESLLVLTIILIVVVPWASCCTVRIDASGIHLAPWLPSRSRHIAFGAVAKVGRSYQAIRIRTSDGEVIELTALAISADAQPVLKDMERAIVDHVRTKTGCDVSLVSYHLQQRDDRFSPHNDTR